jgi:predicted O-methyltransferase YrrM
MFEEYGIWVEEKPKIFLKGSELYVTEYLKPTENIQNIFKHGKVETEKGEIKRISDAVNPYEGYFLYSVIKENKFKKVLEIGMANGISALYMCSALKELNLQTRTKAKSSEQSSNLELISIDPFQKSQWENTGIQTLRNAGLLKYHTLIEELDYLALPKLLKKVGPGYFDMIFIDGNHLFDYTVLDFFFAEKLVKIGGIIVIDDIKHENTGKGYKYIQKNYINLMEIKNTMNSETQGTFVKIANDERPWFFHINF